ncbi:GT-D fold domain-containing glycosyltransferase [Flavobacterium urocaniciphilum]|uniref:Glycosyltransferase GT-D fold domain-containing protein n=1 Tax=Flavobacterium urocaniciphilum TaxID=1299341 RepID=A0A1H8YRP9_9FLAO|nr:GT-D fold domain-containing glycosyltransferase [Flavobacterium urocaniciphilum]SEP54850.1 protein of unknown function [Flavobacterium urocaniciphilum]
MVIKKYIKKILVKLKIIRPKKTWHIVSESEKKSLKNKVKLVKAKNTLEEIKQTIEQKRKGAYLRFGDGDVYLLLGLNDLLQKSDKKLSSEMKETFNLNIGVLHKALAINSNFFGFEPGMVENMHLVSDNDALKYYWATKKYFKDKNVYSPVALHYTAAFDEDFCVDFLKFLKKSNPIFVGNEFIKPDLVNTLFGSTHIKTPSRDAYSNIDVIEKDLIEALNHDKENFRVVVVAMGCSGRILQKRILKKGYNVYLFDFGSLLDAFNGENSRLWIDIVGSDKLIQMLNNI